jgi:hypothetical protein
MLIQEAKPLLNSVMANIAIARVFYAMSGDFNVVWMYVEVIYQNGVLNYYL